MKTVTLKNLSTNNHLLYPDDVFDLGLDSPAEAFMMDFHRERPHVIDANLPVVEAQQLFRSLHASALLVADEQLQLVGVISPEQVSEEALIQRIASGDKREEITIADMMLPRQSMKAVDYSSVLTMIVDDVITTMRSYGEPFLMVLEQGSICGMFTLSDLSWRLHQPLSLEQTPTFAELVTAIAR